MLGSISAIDVVSGSRVTLMQTRSVLFAVLSSVCCAVWEVSSVGWCSWDVSNCMVWNIVGVCCTVCNIGANSAVLSAWVSPAPPSPI